MNRFAPLAIAAAVTLIAGAASAQEFAVHTVNMPQPYGPVRQTTIEVNRADLSSASGARVVLDRLDRAATAVCGGAPHDDDSSDDIARFNACHSEALGSAVRDIRSPALMASLKDRAATLMAKN